VNPEIEIVCDECGSILAVAKVSLTPNENIIIRVGPCQDCVRYAYEEGKDEKE
jgi:hypothetical protein